jgi:predicted nucleic acid-binding protein
MSRTLYVETSALLRALLEHDGSIDAILAEPAAALVTSALTLLEGHRAITRSRRDGRISLTGAREAERRLAAFERAADIREIDAEVLHLARQDLPAEPVRTLDAIHLATLRLFDASEDALALLSCDDRVRRNAEAWGLPVLPRASCSDKA